MPESTRLKVVSIRTFCFAVTAAILATLAITLYFSSWTVTEGESASRPLGRILFWDQKKTDDRVMLLLSWPSETSDTSRPAAYLMNRDGSIHHQWKFDRDPMHARLLDNGNLLVMFFTRPNERLTKSRGECDEIAEFDPEGKKLWSYKNPMLHHDVVRIETEKNKTEKIVTLLTETLSNQDKEKYVPRVTGPALGDSIVVLNPTTGETLWKWSLAEALPDLKDRIEFPDYPSVGHLNSIEYVKSNPWTQTPAFVVSSRQLSLVLVIEESTKKILWTSPRGMMHVQHDAQLLENGNVLVFDNGIHRGQVYTRVLQIDPKTNQIVWQWADPIGFMTVAFMGGAQRLPNGNVLITNSMLGQIVEIEPSGRYVWNFLGRFEEATRKMDEAWWPGTRYYRVISYPRPQYSSSRTDLPRK